MAVFEPVQPALERREPSAAFRIDIDGSDALRRQPSRNGVRREHPLAKTLDTLRSSHPEISLAILEQCGDHLSWPIIALLDRRNTSGIDSDEPVCRANPDIGVVVPDRCKCLGVVESVGRATRGYLGPIPAPDTVVGTDPQVATIDC